MDLNLVNLGVDSYGENLQSYTTDVEMFKTVHFLMVWWI